MYVPLHSRVTEHENSETLKQNDGNFHAIMILTPLARSKLQWWIDYIDTAVNEIHRPDP